MAYSISFRRLVVYVNGGRVCTQIKVSWMGVYFNMASYWNVFVTWKLNSWPLFNPYSRYIENPHSFVGDLSQACLWGLINSKWTFSAEGCPKLLHRQSIKTATSRFEDKKITTPCFKDKNFMTHPSIDLSEICLNFMALPVASALHIYFYNKIKKWPPTPRKNLSEFGAFSQR